MNPNIDPQTEGVLIAEIYRDTVMRVLIGAFDAIMDGEMPPESVTSERLRALVFPPPANPPHPLAKLRKLDGEYAAFVRKHANLVLVNLTTANGTIDALIPRSQFYGIPVESAAQVGEAFRGALVSIQGEMELHIEDFLQGWKAGQHSKVAPATPAPEDGL